MMVSEYKYLYFKILQVVYELIWHVCRSWAMRRRVVAVPRRRTVFRKHG